MNLKIKAFAFLCIGMLAATAVTAGAEYKTENGKSYMMSEERNDISLFADEEPTPLDMPTGLEWNVDRKGEKFLGSVAWDVVPNCEGVYKITCYCDGEQVFYAVWSGLYDHTNIGRVNVEFIEGDAFSKSGKYTFTVQACGDGTNYSDSPIASSGEYNFVCPEAKLDTPTDVKWDETGVVTHNPVENAGGYVYEIYDENEKILGRTWMIENHALTGEERVRENLLSYLKEIAGGEESKDVEKVYVCVRALTSNIELYQNGGRSQATEPYLLSEVRTALANKLTDITAELDNGEIDAKKAFENLNDYMWNSGYDCEDLALVMQQDDNLVGSMKKIEDAYMEQTGIKTGVSDKSDDGEYLKRRGIDIDRISMTGAALNSERGQDVTLNVSETLPGLTVDETFYKNSVGINLNVDGVYNAQRLNFPIQIKMPIPKGVIPDRLVILHYHQDGTIEEIHPAIITENGETYAKFIVTSFSDFVFCNKEETLFGDVNGDGKVNQKDLLRLAKHFAGYDETINEAASDVNADGAVTQKDLLRLAKFFSGYDVKLGEK